MTHEYEITFPYFLLYERLKHICTQLYSYQEGLSIEHNSTSTVSKKHLYLIKLNSWYKEDYLKICFRLTEWATVDSWDPMKQETLSEQPVL